ncbi:MAG: four-helix bundle copper-binding protein [Anaerolineae bacterium]|nr:four-helix bundle copper-binding protein [Anaerolineae bacterium]
MEYMTKFQHMPREIQQCIENCSECHQLCLATVYHCMELGGKYAMPAQITLLLDCAESCQTNANFLLRNSELQGLTAALCADSCTRCAQACERLANGDRQLLDCAKICRFTSTTCDRMVRLASTIPLESLPVFQAS